MILLGYGILEMCFSSIRKAEIFNFVEKKVKRVLGLI